MNKNILHKEVQEYIKNQLHNDLASLALKGSPFDNIDNREILQQVESMAKAEKKLPTWFQTPAIYYPPALSIEQTSSEITAKFKASLVEGNHMVDITGGFGVDDYYFSKHFKTVIHCEVNAALSEVAAHNFKQLRATNINTVEGDGLEYLHQIESTDLIYADPARRDQDRRKVFLLSDCTPDLTKHLEFLFSKSRKILIKTSPLLDLKAGLAELSGVQHIYIVAVKNEVKELLWYLEASSKPEDLLISAVNLDRDSNTTSVFNFNPEEENQSIARTGHVANYLYEPNAAVMKSGAFNLVAERFGLKKLHPNTHLYTGDQVVDFPGRCFRVKIAEDYNKKNVKKLLAGKKANLTTRNFPENVASLRKKFKINDGGDTYAFFCSGPEDRKLLIVTEKI